MALTALGVVAVRQSGFPQRPPVPQERSLWVVNSDRSLIGRINPEVAQLDSAIAIKGAVSVLQDQGSGRAVVIDSTAHQAEAVDPALATIGARVSIPAQAILAAGGGTIASADQSDGRLWFGTSLAALDSVAAKPAATVGPLPKVAVSTAGTVFAVVPGSMTLTTGSLDGSVSTSPLPGGRLSLDGPAGQEDLQLTTVGQVPVVLDRPDGSLRVSGRRLLVSGLAAAVLQQPGPASGTVLVATTTGLIRISLSDGTVSQVATAAGVPSAPVVAGDCAIGIWSAAQPIGVRSCSTQHSEPTPLKGALGSAVLQLVVHGTAVAVTDRQDGQIWLAAEGFRVVDNWAEVAPPDVNDPTLADQTDIDAAQANPPPPPSCGTIPVGKPKAKDDVFGVRAGQPTVISVLANDQIPDCTSALISEVTPLPASVGSVSIVGGGTALQVTTAPGVTGTLPTFRYTVANGRGDTASAAVTVQVQPAGVNKPPQRLRTPATAVEAGATISYNVLKDYLSPTGDDLYLTSATTLTGDAVSFRPDGTITFRSAGGGVGTDRKVTFVVSDGTSQVTGVLVVDIAAAGSSTPVSFPVHISGVVGSPVIADPLKNLTSASALPVQIGKVVAQAGSEAAVAEVTGSGTSVSVHTSTPGSYYFTFEATTGAHSTTGVLRADFAVAGTNGASVPMVDIAYLPAGGSTVIDPLASDSDPAGLGLAVRQVDVSPDANVTAVVVDLHLVHIESAGPLLHSVSLPYSEFDGSGLVTGQIRVVPVPAIKVVPPPVVAPISVTVRAGDAVTIPIADYAISQDGSALTATLADSEVAKLPGRAFSTGTSIRYLAPAVPPARPVVFAYTAVGSTSTELAPVRASSTVTVTVMPAGPAADRAPNAPKPVVARVFARGTITVNLPLDAIDPDGDWVSASSLQRPAAPLGQAQLTGPQTLTYRALSAPGIDRITYLATDPFGKTSIGTVVVLVVPAATDARPPDAPDLTATIRPGGTIRVDPLAVVTDPGGQSVTLGTPPFLAPAGLTVRVDAQALLVTAPPKETILTLRYNVANAQKLTATGALTVTVSATAQLLPPVATDVFVPPTDLGRSTDAVAVDVSAHITNQSGSQSALTVSVDPQSAAQASVVASTIISVKLTPVRQVVAYRIQDGQGGIATAFLVAPGRAQLVGPQLIANTQPILVDAGKTVTVKVADYITVSTGTPVLTVGVPIPISQGTAVRVDAGTIALTEPLTAGGTEALYVSIDSGSGAPTVLSLPVEIVPHVVPPPALTGTNLLIAAGTAQALDLGPLTRTANVEQTAKLKYSVADPVAGFHVTLAGSQLAVSVDANVPRKTTDSLEVQVADTSTGSTGSAIILLTVTGSRAPLAKVVNPPTVTGRAGIAASADVLVGSSDPIGLGLSVGRLTVAGGTGGISGSPTLTGSTISVIPAIGYIGDITINFMVTDGTHDPERAVSATMTVTVQAVPSAPGTPSRVDGDVSATAVDLRWEPSSANGAKVTGYTVTSGLKSILCMSESSCSIPNLTPGSPYRFTVVAHNAVGDSLPSPSSDAITPDDVPIPPKAILVNYVIGQPVVVTWDTPTGLFSLVTSFSGKIFKNGIDVLDVDLITSPWSIPGLDPTASYTFEVAAKNHQGMSAFSAPSNPVQPSGTPGAPTLAYTYDYPSQQVTLTWGPPADNGGHEITDYQLTVSGQLGQPKYGPDTHGVVVPCSGPAWCTYTLVALGSHGDSSPPASVTVQPFSKPTMNGVLKIDPGLKKLVVSWAPGTTPGDTIDHYEYQLAGAGWIRIDPTILSVTIPNLTPKSEQAVNVRVCNSKTYNGSEVCSEPSPGKKTPYGDPPSPTFKDPVFNPDGSVTINWTLPNDGVGRPLVSSTVNIDPLPAGATQPAVTSWPWPNQSSGSWTSPPGSWTMTFTATGHTCVSGPSECIDGDKRTETVPPSPTTLYTVTYPGATSADTDPGTCGVPSIKGGAWLSEDLCQPSGGVWRKNGTSVNITSCFDDPANSYPTDPTNLPQPTSTSPTTLPPAMALPPPTTISSAPKTTPPPQTTISPPQTTISPPPTTTSPPPTTTSPPPTTTSPPPTSTPPPPPVPSSTWLHHVSTGPGDPDLWFRTPVMTGTKQLPCTQKSPPATAHPALSRSKEFTVTAADRPLLTAEEATTFADQMERLVEHVGRALVGKPDVIRLAYLCLFAEGHLLLEDVPGTGKTTLAKALAASISGTSSRIQFTPDLLPSDVTGVTIFDQAKAMFEFHPGPVFASIVLADEINRASPKTQSALLEVMEESAVTVDGVTREVGSPFMVIGTQNPIEQAGTYRLPEAQLDRFLMRLEIGHPSTEAALAILTTVGARSEKIVLGPVLPSSAVTQLARDAARVYVDPSVLRYITAIAEATRTSKDVALGISQRGAIGLLRTGKVRAASMGRNYVTPDDVKALAGAVLTHRIAVHAEAEFNGVTAAGVLAGVLEQVQPPRKDAK